MIRSLDRMDRPTAPVRIVKRTAVAGALALSLALATVNPWYHPSMAHAASLARPLAKPHCHVISDRGTWWLLSGDDPGEGFSFGVWCTR